MRLVQEIQYFAKSKAKSDASYSKLFDKKTKGFRLEHDERLLKRMKLELYDKWEKSSIEEDKEQGDSGAKMKAFNDLSRCKVLVQ